MVEKCVIPLVLDADALIVLGRGAVELLSRRKELVLTPHPGELDRLTGVRRSLESGFDAAAKLSAAANCVVLLKGEPSQFLRTEADTEPHGKPGHGFRGQRGCSCRNGGGVCGSGSAPSAAASQGAFFRALRRHRRLDPLCPVLCAHGPGRWTGAGVRQG